MKNKKLIELAEGELLRLGVVRKETARQLIEAAKGGCTAPDNERCEYWKGQEIVKSCSNCGYNGWQGTLTDGCKGCFSEGGHKNWEAK